MKLNSLSFINMVRPSFSAQKPDNKTATNTLERTPVQDTIVINSNAKQIKETALYLKKYEIVNESKILGKILIELMAPQKDEKDNLYFTKQQQKIIDLAIRRIDFYKDLADKLAKDGNDSIENIIKQTKAVFGGEKGLGKYVHSRERNGIPKAKDAVSIYNKLIKEFKSKQIENEILDAIAQPNFKKDYKDLDKSEKALLQLEAIAGNLVHKLDFKDLEKTLKVKPNDRKNAIASVKDLIGLRLILPDNIDMQEVENYLTKAMLNGKINVKRVSNYHSSHIHPYISKDTIKLWRESVPGLFITNSNDTRKKNGYTTTQLNIDYVVTDKNGKEKIIHGELQIRSASLNKVGQIEHLIYDILEGKNISKDIPELKEFYDSIGIIDAVNEVFNTPQKENAYQEYEKTIFSRIRNTETNQNKTSKEETEYPLLADFGLGSYEVLSFESLDYIDKKTAQIKKKYGKNN